MGEVLLDSENLFFGFGWTPDSQHQPERRRFLRQFAAHPRLEGVSGRRAVESLGRSSVHALTDWARRYIATWGEEVLHKLSYGKKDRGVRTVMAALRDEGYVHMVVPYGRNIAEQQILQRLDGQGWRREPYVIGSSDKAVPRRMSLMLTDRPGLRAVLVMRPDVYEQEKGKWFHSIAADREPLFPQLGEYGVGHIALHKITNDYLATQSAARTRRAPPLVVDHNAAAPRDSTVAEPAALSPQQQWDLWSRYTAPKPGPQRPLNSSEWIKACRGRKIPAAVYRPLKESIEELYGDAFETGDGPVSWGLACRGAASIPLVQAHPAAAPDGLGDTRQTAYEEARTRLMSRAPAEQPPRLGNAMDSPILR